MHPTAHISDKIVAFNALQQTLYSTYMRNACQPFNVYDVQAIFFPLLMSSYINYPTLSCNAHHYIQKRQFGYEKYQQHLYSALPREATPVLDTKWLQQPVGHKEIIIS